MAHSTSCSAGAIPMLLGRSGLAGPGNFVNANALHLALGRALDEPTTAANLGVLDITNRTLYRSAVRY